MYKNNHILENINNSFYKSYIKLALKLIHFHFLLRK